MRIEQDSPLRPDVLALLTEHLADMRATSPPEATHALNPAALTDPSVVFLTARDDDVLLGCGAVKVQPDGWGEVKSMRTSHAARGRGVGAAIVVAIVEAARARGLDRLNLETGTQEYFSSAHRLYERLGFVPCPPFGGYREDPHSRFFTLELTTVPQPPAAAPAPPPTG